MEAYSPEELECALYVEWALGRPALESFLLSTFQGRRDGFTLIFSTCSISISQNRPEGYPIKDRVFDAKYRLDISPNSSTTQQAYIDQVTLILTRFWVAGADAAAMTSFEELLPELGGYLTSPIAKYQANAQIQRLPPDCPPVLVYEPHSLRLKFGGKLYTKSLYRQYLSAVIGYIAGLCILALIAEATSPKPFTGSFWILFALAVPLGVAIALMFILLAHFGGQSFRFKHNGVHISDIWSDKTWTRFKHPIHVSILPLPDPNCVSVTLTYPGESNQEQLNVICTPEDAEKIKSLYTSTDPSPDRDIIPPA